MRISKNWTSFIKPEIVQYQPDPNGDINSNIVVVEPLEKGFAVTVGNALRRILLSSIRGASVSAMRINGVDHEYVAVQGIKEDITDIVLNLKSIIVRINDNEEKKRGIIDIKGPCVVTAGMIDIDNGIEILNKDQLICTITSDKHLVMEVFFEAGRGYYVPADPKDYATSGLIPIDKAFNPVQKVAMTVENTRVGKATDYDRLIMLVKTNGAITPELAVNIAAKILQEHMQLLINVPFASEKDEAPKTQTLINKALFKKIDKIELGVRARNCLLNSGCLCVGDVAVQTKSMIEKMHHAGKKTVEEIEEKVLLRHGLNFGTEVPGGWPPENLSELIKKYEEEEEE